MYVTIFVLRFLNGVLKLGKFLVLLKKCLIKKYVIGEFRDSAILIGMQLRPYKYVYSATFILRWRRIAHWLPNLKTSKF